MVCIPCIVIPALLFIWHRFLQPIVLKFWNPWRRVEDKKEGSDKDKKEGSDKDEKVKEECTEKAEKPEEVSETELKSNKELETDKVVNAETTELLGKITVNETNSCGLNRRIPSGDQNESKCSEESLFEENNAEFFPASEQVQKKID